MTPFERLLKALKNLFQGLKKLIKKLLERLMKPFERLLQAFEDRFQGLHRLIKSAFERVMTPFERLLQASKTFSREAYSKKL